MTRSLSRYRGQGGRRTMIHPESAEHAGRWCGRTPTYGWKFDQASPGVRTLFGGAALTAINSLSAYQTVTPYANLTAATWADSGTAYLYNTGFGDDGVTSYAWLLHCRAGTLNAGKFYHGKSGGSNIMLLSNQAAGLQFQIKDGTTSKFAVATGAHSDKDFWAWVSVDRTADLMWCASRVNSASTDITGQGSSGNGSTWRLGGFGSVASDFLALYRFEGVAAEGDPLASLNMISRFAGG